jgi:hypothetical protein
MSIESIIVKGQVGPCGLLCEECVLGNGTIAETAKKTNEYIQNYGVKDWGPSIPGGADIDWEKVEKGLEWMNTYCNCVGCEKGGGAPDCSIRICANEKNYELCNECTDVKTCNKFNWLGETGNELRNNLALAKEKTKKDWITEKRGSNL